MIHRYTITRNPLHPHLVCTRCDELLGDSAAWRLAQSLYTDRMSTEAHHYAGLAYNLRKNNSTLWETCWSEQGDRSTIPHAVIMKLMRRGRWRGAEPKLNKPIVYAVCEY